MRAAEGVSVKVSVKLPKIKSLPLRARSALCSIASLMQHREIQTLTWNVLAWHWDRICLWVTLQDLQFLFWGIQLGLHWLIIVANGVPESCDSSGTLVLRARISLQNITVPLTLSLTCTTPRICTSGPCVRFCSVSIKRGQVVRGGNDISYVRYNYRPSCVVSSMNFVIGAVAIFPAWVLRG